MYWLPILKSLEVKARVLVLSQEITFKNFQEGHDNLILDGHLWHDPGYVIQYIKSIENILLSLYPKWAHPIRSAAHAYVQNLLRLDQWIKKQWFGRKKGAGLVAHDGMTHYKNRYSITLYPVPEIRHHQGKYLKNLMQRKICAVFPEQGHNSHTLHQWAADLNIKLEDPLCIDDLALGETYVGMMRKNTKILCQGLTLNIKKKISSNK